MCKGNSTMHEKESPSVPEDRRAIPFRMKNKMLMLDCRRLDAMSGNDYNAKP